MNVNYTKIAILLLTFGALFLRLEYVANTVIDHPLRADAKQYAIYGYNLAHHGTFSQQLAEHNPRPDSFRSPGYPALVAIAFRIAGDQRFYPLIVFVQVILSTLLVPLTYLVGCFIIPSGWVVVAAIFVAFCPHLITITSYLLTETLFAFLLIAALACFLKGIAEGKAGFLYAAAIIFGYAYLTNQTVLFLPILFFAITLYLSLQKGRSPLFEPLSRHICISLIIFSLFPAGWMLRNAVSVPAGAPKGSQRALATLSHGSYPDFMYKTPEFKYFPYREDPQQPMFGSSLGNFIRIFGKRFRKDPRTYLSWYLFKKPYYLWSWSILQGEGDVYIYPVKQSLYRSSALANATRIFMKSLHPVLLFLALIGCPLVLYHLSKDGIVATIVDGSLLLFILILYYTIVYTVFVPWPRYAIPLRPELYLWATWSAKTLTACFGRKAWIFGKRFIIALIAVI